MEKAESRKIYIENQLTFDRERARIEAHTMWKNSAGGAPVFGGFRYSFFMHLSTFPGCGELLRGTIVCVTDGSSRQ